MKAYKGFSKDMTCRGFQYEEGKGYEEKKAECCESGFHACEYPLDCFEYYAPNDSVYHEVELDGDIDTCDGEDSKAAATKIKIGARLNIGGLVKAAINFTMSRVKPEAKADEEHGHATAENTNGAAQASGDYGAAQATGRCGAAQASGDYGAAQATGRCGAAQASGHCGAAQASGDYGAAQASGDYGAAQATGRCGAAQAAGYNGAAQASGDYGAAQASGHYGAAQASGDYGAAQATGRCGAAQATGRCGAAQATGYKSTVVAAGPECIAVAFGYKSKAKGVKGSYLVLAEWEGNDDKYWKPDAWKLKGVKTVHIDGRRYKADTFYELIGGKVTAFNGGA